MSTLTRQNTLPIDEISSTTNIIELVEESLRIFGLNDFKLGSFDEMFTSFEIMTKNMIKNKNDYGTFQSSDPLKPYKILNYSRIKKDGTLEENTFTFVKFLSEGSFNQTAIYTDKDDKTVIIRRTNYDSSKLLIKQQYVSFYENLKHIILYILIRKYISDINNKFVPRPYHLGFLQLSANNFNTIMVMESGKMDLDKNIGKYMGNDTETKIKILVCKVYYMLYMIETRLNINFKHNDCKGDNIVITDGGEPMLIDFALSEFTLDKLTLDKVEFKAYGYNDKNDTCYILSNTMYTNSKYNLVHDILQLIVNLWYIFKNVNYYHIFTIFTFTKDKNKYIMDGSMLKKYIDDKIDLLPDDKPDEMPYLFTYFYGIDNSSKDKLKDKPINLEEDIKDGIIFPDSIIITPQQFAENIGVSIADLVVDKYYRKYLKYKQKYFELKK